LPRDRRSGAEEVVDGEKISVRPGAVKRIHLIDARGKTNSVADERESNVTVANEQDRTSGWYSSHWESHNNKRPLFAGGGRRTRTHEGVVQCNYKVKPLFPVLLMI
jgi:hypothetical protein